MIISYPLVTMRPKIRPTDFRLTLNFRVYSGNIFICLVLLFVATFIQSLQLPFLEQTWRKVQERQE